jgi:dynein heavy chain
MRVFHDRLIDEPDRVYFKEILREQITVFGLEEEEVLNCERIMYGDFGDGKD